MSFSKFDNISQAMREDLIRYIDFLMWQYRLVDAFWFLITEKTFSLEVASKLNADVWGRIGTHMARDIKRRFKISGKGVDAVLEALSYNPWAFITNYGVERREGVAVISVTHCAPQEARRKHGKSEFLFKNMHVKFFMNFSKEIDDKVRVRCLFAPPDSHPKDLWCRWEFFDSASPMARGNRQRKGRRERGKME